ncbi:MAG: MEDS domain-containing protein [Terriglobales bacterium]
MFHDRRESPLVHSVHFYDHDSELIDRLRGIVITALATGNAVLIVASEDHRRELTASLHNNWTNWAAARDEGRLLLVDAQETLSQFMVEGRPNRERFRDAVGNLIRECRFTARSANRGLTAFGEMVAILWKEGNRQAALELESLWNELLSDRTFHLHCAYPKHAMTSAGDDLAFQSVCEHHSHIIGQPLLRAA